jgi:hypothetical protein
MRTNTRMKLTALAAAMGLVVSSGAFADNEATQNVTVTVPTIQEISVTDATVSLVMVAPAAGSQVAPITNQAAGTWSISTNSTSATQKLSAQISAGVGAGLKLTVNAAAPDAITGGVAAPGVLSLDEDSDDTPDAAEIVTTIPAVFDSGMVITYTLEPTSATAIPAAVSTTPTVTFTLTDS